MLLDEIATNRGGASLGVSWPNYLDWRAQNQAFSDLGCYQTITFTLTGVGEAEELSGAFISDRLFESAWRSPQLGRAFTPEENQPAHHRVVILSHGLWQSRFGGDQNLWQNDHVGQSRVRSSALCRPVSSFPERLTFWTRWRTPPGGRARCTGWARCAAQAGRHDRTGAGRNEPHRPPSRRTIPGLERRPGREGHVLLDHLVEDRRRGLCCSCSARSASCC